jgi:hypothetical protein
MVNSLLPQPPLDFVPARFPQHMFSVAGVLVLAAILYLAIKDWKKTGSPYLVLILLGGVFTVIWEPIIDYQLFVYHGEPADDMLAFTALGRGIPWWVVAAWTEFCGGITALLVLLMSRPGGMTQKLFWGLVGGAAVANLLIEVPMINAGTYVYYGPYQAFQYFGFPFWWADQNMLGPLIGAAILFRARAWFTGPKVLVATLVPVMAYGAGYSAANFPILVAMTSAADPLALHLCAGLTFALALLIIYGVSQFVCSDVKVPTLSSAKKVQPNGT